MQIQVSTIAQQHNKLMVQPSDNLNNSAVIATQHKA